MTFVPNVTLAIVSHGRPAELALALRALRLQRQCAFEVVVVSDLAPDARPSASVPVRWISYQDRNISVARNLALSAARGNIIAFTDDDAVPLPDWLSALTAPFADRRIGYSAGFVRDRSGLAFQWKCALTDRLARDHVVQVRDTGPTIFAPDADRCLKASGVNAAFRVDALRALGGFDPMYRFYLEDTDMCRRLSDAGWHAATVPTAQVIHSFAASALRTARRVPRTLTDIAASEAYFLSRHAPDGQSATRLAQMRAAHDLRLLRAYHLGMLDGTDLARLREQVADRHARGPDPVSGLRLAQTGTRPFRAVDLPPLGPPVTVAAGLRDLAQARRRAARLAAMDRIVTLTYPLLDASKPRLAFAMDGYFVRTKGILRPGAMRWARSGQTAFDPVPQIAGVVKF